MRRPDSAILLLAVGQTLIWASTFYVFPAMLLRWEQDLGWSKPDLAAAITMAILVAALASPLVGRTIDRGHGAVLIGVSAGLGGLCLLALSGVQTRAQFYAVWLVLGLAMSGCLYEPCFAIVTRARGVQAKPAIILITLAAGFASTLSFPTVYWLSESLGWRGAVQVIGVVVIAIVAPILWLGAALLKETAQTTTPPPGQKVVRKAFLRTRAFWFLALGMACFSLTHGAVLQHLLPLLNERGLSPEMAVLAASFIGPMQVAGRLAMMASERRLSDHLVAMAAFGALMLSIALLAWSAALPALLAGFVILFGSAYGTVSILRPLLARDILGQENFGAKSGALALPYLAGSALAPYLGALLWGVGGYDLMLGAVFFMLALGSLLYRAARVA